VLVYDESLHLAADIALGVCPYVAPTLVPAPEALTSSTTLAITVSVIVCSLLFVIVTLCVIGWLVYAKFVWKRRRYFDGEAEREMGTAAAALEMDRMNNSSTPFSYREVDWDELTLGRLLGQGAFGKVYKGEYRCVLPQNCEAT
jgi:hypothetical protein